MTVSTKTYEVRQVPGNNSVAIDGYGSDQVWKSAVILDDFSFPWLNTSAPRTLFRSLWNADHLYFRFDVSDEDIVLAACADAKERAICSDRVEIFLSTAPDLKPYYGFEIDPRGEVLSYRANFHHRMDWGWNCPELQVRASQDDDGYLVEGAIPMTTLRRLQCLQANDGGLYIVAGLFRAEFSHGEDGQIIKDWIAWIDPQLDQPDFHVPSAFGRLKLLRS